MKALLRLKRLFTGRINKGIKVFIQYKKTIAVHYLLVASAANICKEFGPRSGLTKCRAWSRSKLFDTLIVFLKEFFEKVNFEKPISRRQKSMKNYPVCKKIKQTYQSMVKIQTKTHACTCRATKCSYIKMCWWRTERVITQSDIVHVSYALGCLNKTYLKEHERIPEMSERTTTFISLLRMI